MTQENGKKGCTVGGDRVQLGAALANGQVSYVRHKADHTLEQGTCSVLRDGEPLLGREMLTLVPDPERGDYIVEDSFADPTGRKGPAHVASKAYDDGWARTFGNRKDLS